MHPLFRGVSKTKNILIYGGVFYDREREKTFIINEKTQKKEEIYEDSLDQWSGLVSSRTKNGVLYSNYLFGALNNKGGDICSFAVFDKLSEELTEHKGHLVFSNGRFTLETYDFDHRIDIYGVMNVHIIGQNWFTPYVKENFPISGKRSA